MPLHARKAFLEHVAIYVKDIAWHIRFFDDVFGMTLREVDGAADAPKQVWVLGGIQFISDPAFAGPEGRLAHLGVMAEDRDAILAAAKAKGIKSLPQGEHWLSLPDGLCVEVLQANPPIAVAAALAVNARVAD